MFFPSLGLLFALSTGVLPNDTLFKRGRIQAMIRHQEGPLPVQLFIRTTDNPKPAREDWLYIKDVKHFPRRVIANPTGRKVSVTLPVGLKKYSQLCSFHEPQPDRNAGPGNGFQMRFSLESCANIYQKRQ
jgi:hypothetical protein